MGGCVVVAAVAFCDKRIDIVAAAKACTKILNGEDGSLPDPKAFRNLVVQMKKDAAVLKAIADNVAKL